MIEITRLSTGIKEFDKLIAGGIPEGFFVAVVGEPGTGKTIFCLHFAAEGVRVGDKVIYVTTEESRESIIKQALMFNWDFKLAIDEGRMVIIDALMRPKDDEWSIQELTPENLVEKVIEAKKYLGYGRARLIVDSMSAFWLDKPAMARKYSYYVKRVLSRWNFTALLVSQYAITTESAFGFGLEHVADGIIRFRREVKGGVLRRYIIIEKMRQTPHDRHMWEIDIVDGKGIVLLKRLETRREDYALPESVKEMIIRSKERSKEALE